MPLSDFQPALLRLGTVCRQRKREVDFTGAAKRGRGLKSCNPARLWDVSYYQFEIMYESFAGICVTEYLQSPYPSVDASRDFGAPLPQKRSYVEPHTLHRPSMFSSTYIRTPASLSTGHAMS